jgi:hypothetical protein
VLDPASAINPTDSSPPDIRDLAQSAQDELKSISQSLLTARGIGGEVIVRYGNVRDIILQIQQECSADILVIGSSGRKIGRGKALGSTAEALLRGAPCDVLTIGPHVEWGSVSAKTRSLLFPTDILRLRCWHFEWLFHWLSISRLLYFYSTSAIPTTFIPASGRKRLAGKN